MPMHIAALAVIAVQGVTGLEIELFGNAYFAHVFRLKGKGSNFQERFLERRSDAKIIARPLSSNSAIV